uniref:MFS domain-containing protein n=1 Tax=Rhabditophanes sp. KR3021 TaxID=114890 RepID=A0AC35UH54_9BILA
MIGGLGDSIISPSASSLLGRWFPTKERSLIQTLVGAGRQVGSLIIFPTAGYLSNKSGGWPLAFYVSGGIVAIILFAWFVFSADKPSKSRFISDNEIKFIEERLAVGEKHGKRTERKKTPWKQILKNKAVWMGTMALVCHEFPLVITMTLIPRYLKDILKFESGGMLGLLSFLPTGSIFLSKVICMAISGYVTKKKKGHSSGAPTKVAKIFNFFASLGLGLCLCIIPLLSNPNHSTYCMIVLCLGCFFAGLHSFGVCAALLTIAPAYSGIVNGIAYTVVAIFSIINKLGSYYILQTGAPWEWNLIFLTSGVVALLPCFFFTLWGSADIQPFAIKREGSVTGSAITGSSSISSLSRSNSKTNVGGRPPPLKISPSISSNISEKFNFENNLGANSTPTSRLPSCNMEIPLTPKPKTPPKIVVQDDDADLEHN